MLSGILSGALGVAAVVFGAYGVTTNAVFWWRALAGSLEAQIALTGVSVAADVIKMAVPLYLYAHGLTWRAEKKLTGVFAFALLFSLWSGAGYLDQTRHVAAQKGAERNAARASALEAQRSANLKFNSTPTPTRAHATVKADLAAAEEAAPRTCKGPTAAAQASCKKVVELRREFAGHDAYRTAAADKAAADALVASTPELDDRPEVTGARRMLSRVGLDVSRGVLEAVWVVVLLALAEIAPPTMVASLATPRARRPVTPSHAALTPLTTQPPRSSPARRAGRQTPTPADLAAYVRTLPADASGFAPTPVRAVAAALGVPASSADRLIRGALASGEVVRDTSKRALALRAV